MNRSRPDGRYLGNVSTPLLVPRLSEFFGIVIYLYWGETGQHNTPHFHAQYGGDEAVLSIPGADILAGALPRRQMRLV